jgi:hypothetical protein
MDWINTLPDEVLSLIFHQDSLGATLTTPDNLVHIILTCRRWRDLALDLPTLWCKIYLHQSAPTGHTLSLGRVTDGQTDYWLKNSRNSLLDIYLENDPREANYGQGGHKTATLKKMLPVLLRESQRWRTAGLQGSHIIRTLQRTFLSKESQEQISFPNLRYLSLKAILLSRRGHDVLTPFFSHGLRRLELISIHVNTNLWSQLIEATPQIEDIEYTDTRWSGDTPEALQGCSVAHKNLSRLCYRTKEHDVELAKAESRILYSLINRCPRLESLELGDEKDVRGLYISHLPRLFGGDGAEWFASQPPINSVKYLKVALSYTRSPVGTDVRNLSGFSRVFQNVEHLLVSVSVDGAKSGRQLYQLTGTKRLNEEINGLALELANLRSFTLDEVPINVDCFIDLARNLHRRRLSSYPLLMDGSDVPSHATRTEGTSTAAEPELKVRPGDFICKTTGDYEALGTTPEWVPWDGLQKLVELEVPGFKMTRL